MISNNADSFSSNTSFFTIVEISKKVTELLDNMGYSNSEMLITREHIKYNLAQLISSSDSQVRATEDNIAQNSQLKRKRKSNFTHNL